MGSVAGIILNLDGSWGLRGWQWLFLIEGFPAVLLSIAFLKYLPDAPQTAAWLTPPERQWIGAQLAAEGADTPGGLVSSSHLTGVGAALTDPRVWLFGIVNLLMLGTSYGYTFSAPAILQNLTHLDNTRVGFIISAFGLLGAAGMLFNAWLSDRTGRRYLHIFAPALLDSACFVVVALVMKPWIAVPIFALMLFAHNAMQGPLLATPTTFLKGKGAAAGLATINMVGILGGVLFPPMMGWFRDRSGNYQTGLGILALTMLVSAGVVFVLRTMARAANRRSVFSA